MNPNCNSANAGRFREGSIFDTLELAAGAAIASTVLFNSSNAGGPNTHKCNLASIGELGEGESFLVKRVMIEFIGTSIADISQIQKACTFTLEIAQQKVIRDQTITMFPQPGGAFGIEGANGGSANGAQGWNAIKELDEPILIEGKRTIRLMLNKTGATAAVGASGLFMRVHLHGTDMTAG